MAKKDDRKNQKKRLKEQKKATAQAKHAAARAKAERYPEITYETSEGNGYFVAEVRAVAETLDFASPEMGPDWMREFISGIVPMGLRQRDSGLRIWKSRLASELSAQGSSPTHSMNIPAATNS